MKNYLFNYDYDMYPLKRFGDACKQFGYDYFERLIPDVELTHENFFERVWCGYKITEDEYNHLIDLCISIYYPNNDVVKEYLKKSSIKRLILDYKKK